MDVLSGTDFFTVEVLTLKGFMTYYVLFLIHLETRRVCLAGITPYPGPAVDGATSPYRDHEGLGFLAHSRYLLHDRYGELSSVFREMVKAAKVRPLKSPTRSPNL